MTRRRQIRVTILLLMISIESGGPCNIAMQRSALAVPLTPLAVTELLIPPSPACMPVPLAVTGTVWASLAMSY
jgi:hypothetical protein